MKKLAIFGAPRSGTSLLGQLFNSSPNVAYRYQPLFSYAFKGRLSEQSSKDEIDAFHNELLSTQDEFVLQVKNVSGKENLVFPKSEITTLVWKEVRYMNLIENLLLNSDLKIIGLLRHPGAVLQSWFKAPKEFNPDWNRMEEWKHGNKKNQQKPEEFYGYERWKELFFMFSEFEKRFPEKFTIVRYENLVRNTEKELQRLFTFGELNFDEQVKAFIKSSTSSSDNDPYGVFKIKTDLNDWKKEIDPLIISEMEADMKKNKIEYEE